MHSSEGYCMPLKATCGVTFFTGLRHIRSYAAQGQLSTGSSAGAADLAASVNMLKAWQARALWPSQSGCAH